KPPGDSPVPHPGGLRRSARPNPALPFSPPAAQDCHGSASATLAVTFPGRVARGHTLPAFGGNKVERLMEEVPPDSEETRTLLAQIQDGNSQAFDRLLGHHRSTLRRFIELRLDTRLRARVDPSDVVQETQLEVFHRLPDYLRRRPMPFHL